jgi:hypothetical protein
VAIKKTCQWGSKVDHVIQFANLKSFSKKSERWLVNLPSCLNRFKHTTLRGCSQIMQYNEGREEFALVLCQGIKASVFKTFVGLGGVKNLKKLHYLIYGQPL